MFAIRSGLVSSLNGISGVGRHARLDHAEHAEQDDAEDDRAERGERAPALQARFDDAVDEHHLADRQRQRAGQVEAARRRARRRSRHDRVGDERGRRSRSAG